MPLMSILASSLFIDFYIYFSLYKYQRFSKLLIVILNKHTLSRIINFQLLKTKNLELFKVISYSYSYKVIRK